jgi:putative membrane protein
MRIDPDGGDADRGSRPDRPAEPGSGTSAGERSETGDASRRTHLANERTQLAWWRTGLTALAVGVGVGRVVPELGGGNHVAYAILGVAFVLYGIAFILTGTWRQRQVERAVMAADWRAQDRWLVLGLTVAGVALSAATGVLMLVDL